MYDPDTPESCGCRGTGWLGEDAEGRPIPCLMHKPHLVTGGRSEIHDYAEREPSERARAAIEKADHDA